MNIDLIRKLVDIDGKYLFLTGEEYLVLELLARNQGTSVGLGNLDFHRAAWGNGLPVSSLETVVGRLASKLSLASQGRNNIEAEWGLGYQLLGTVTLTITADRSN